MRMTMWSREEKGGLLWLIVEHVKWHVDLGRYVLDIAETRGQLAERDFYGITSFINQSTHIKDCVFVIYSRIESIGSGLTEIH
jgi:hypothetical protein